MEKSLVFIKPWSIEQAEEILNFLDNSLKENFEKTPPKFIKPSPEIIKKHYEHLNYLPYFEEIINSIKENGIVLSVYSGEDIIKRVRNIIGPTDPAQAPPHTIRGKFSSDSLKLALEQSRPLKNVIHASKDKKEAEKEFKLWLEHLQ